MSKINEILNSFNFKGELVSYEEFGSGHINTTFLAHYKDEDKDYQYVVQKINDNVFKNVDALMNNVFAVTKFLRNKIKDNGGDKNRETLNYIKTRDGQHYYKSKDNEYYRAYRFIDNSKAYDNVESAEVFGKSGTAFGKFQKYLADFPASTLHEIIPNFHNTAWRFENEFLLAVESDCANRASECKDEIKFVMDRRSDCFKIIDLIESKKVPIRVTHNDTKLNNVLFDNDSDDAICVIDLDTVMPGSALYDFGDSIRFGANTCAEDEKDTDKVKIDLDYFKSYATGFLSEAGESFTDAETDNLAFSAKLMTFECGMRFLTDYLNGDVYFKTGYPEHNLVRAKNQFALVRDMEKKMDEMENIIKEIAGK